MHHRHDLRKKYRERCRIDAPYSTSTIRTARHSAGLQTQNLAAPRSECNGTAGGRRQYASVLTVTASLQGDQG